MVSRHYNQDNKCDRSRQIIIREKAVKYLFWQFIVIPSFTTDTNVTLLEYKLAERIYVLHTHTHTHTRARAHTRTRVLPLMVALRLTLTP